MFVMEEKWAKTEPFLLKGDWQGMAPRSGLFSISDFRFSIEKQQKKPCFARGFAGPARDRLQGCNRMTLMGAAMN